MTTLTSPHDLIAAIPFLIGYHPTDSLVLVSLKAGAVSMAMRVDYPETSTSEDFDALVSHLTRNGADSALVVAYVPLGSSNGEEFLLSIGNALTRANIVTSEALLISDGRWRSTLCQDLQCCPPEGRELPEIGASRIAAEQVSSGKVMPFANEEELAGSLASAPLADDEQFINQVLLARIDQESPRLGACQKEGAVAVIDLASRFIAGSMGADIQADQELSARVLGALSDIQVRDFALGSHAQATHEIYWQMWRYLVRIAPVATHEIYWQMWRYLVRIAPVGFVAPVATLFAATSYERGDGALAQRALDRAFSDDAGYSLTALLRRVFSAGWPPESFAQMRKDLHPKVCAGIFETQGEKI
ncbi:MAG: DUF4192 domain-containing protein [Actinobacteria bacterium]|nr:DUF4192 domain-containing protein [Actinomycetota bacterium]